MCLRTKNVLTETLVNSDTNVSFVLSCVNPIKLMTINK